MFPEAPSRGRLEDAKGRLGGAEQKPGRNKEAVRAFRLSPSACAEGISALRKAPGHLSSIFPEVEGRHDAPNEQMGGRWGNCPSADISRRD